MSLFNPPEDMLIAAMSAKQPFVRLERCIGSLDAVFRNALKKEPRLLAFLSSYQANYMKKGLVQLTYDYDVTITYQDHCPASLSDVEIDNGVFDITTFLKKGKPQPVTVITTDPQAIGEKLNENLHFMLSKYEGICGWQTSSLTFDKLTKDVVCSISYDYLLPEHLIRQSQGKAMFAAKNIWKTILGRSKVPAFVKPFLAFSYITQECCYDQRAYDEVADNPGEVPSDAVPHMAYGPLVEKRGICGGLAWAFKTMMDEAGIECLCISGYLKEDMKVGHMWNLVRIEGQYYHVDPTWGIKNSGVHINGLMQPDAMMRCTHVWDETKYPKATGMHYDYDFIEDYLVDYGNDFIDDGANETYFFPDEIID